MTGVHLRQLIVTPGEAAAGSPVVITAVLDGTPPDPGVDVAIAVPSQFAGALTLPNPPVIRIRGGKTEWVPVKTGLTSGPLVEVFGDLGAGDEVAGEESGEFEVGSPADVADGTVVGAHGSVRGQQFGKTDAHGGTCAPQEKLRSTASAWVVFPA